MVQSVPLHIESLAPVPLASNAPVLDRCYVRSCIQTSENSVKAKFAEFALRDCLKNGRRASGARVSVALNSDRWRVFCSSEPLVGSRFEARFDFSDSLSTHSGG